MRISPLVAALLMLCSCVTADEEGEGRPTDEEADWRTGGKGDGETCDFAAMSAQTYYDQFAYKMVERPSGKWYRVGLTWDIEGRLDNGNDVDLNVYFLASNRVIVEYSEQQRQGGGQSEVLNETVIVTRATIDPATRAITIAGLGSGTPL